MLDESVEFASDGRAYDKRDVIEALQHERPFRRSIVDFRLRPLAKAVVLATFRAIREDTYSGVIVSSLRSAIWCRGANEWQPLLWRGGVPGSALTPPRRPHNVLGRRYDEFEQGWKVCAQGWSGV
jgi:hypothetical protein